MKKEPLFQLKLSSLGTNYANYTYAIQKSKNAFQLLRKSVITIAKEFVKKENVNSILYDLAIDILNDVIKDEKKESFNLIEKIKNLKKSFETSVWTIRLE